MRLSARRLFALAVIVGVGLRLAWVLSGDFEPVSEANFYHQHATDLAEGRGYINPETGEPSAFLPPGYPALLAPFYWLTTASPRVAGMVNAGLAGIAIAGVFALTRQRFGEPPAAAAAWLLAIFPSQVLYATAVHSDHLFAALVPWVLVAGGAAWTGTAGRVQPLAAGALVGLCGLAAPIALLLLPAIGVSRLVASRSRSTLRPLALAAFACAAVLAPWTVRNWGHFDAFVPVSTNGGVNLWIGNNENAGSGWMPWSESHWGYPRDEVAVDREYRDDALRYMAREPVEAVSRWPGKLRHTFMQDYNYVEHFSLAPRVGAMPPGMNGQLLHWLAARYYLGVLLLAAAALVAAPRRSGPIVAAAVALALPTVLFFGLDRYHVPILPLVASLAGATLLLLPRPLSRPEAITRLPRLPRWASRAEGVPERR